MGLMVSAVNGAPGQCSQWGYWLVLSMGLLVRDVNEANG